MNKLIELLGTAIGMNFVLAAISWAVGGAIILVVLVVLFFMGKIG